LLKHLVGAYALQRAVGLTLNRSHVEYVAGYADPRIEVRAESWAEHVPADAYDVVFAWGVLEHAVSFDLSPAEKAKAYRQFFQTCHGWLKPGGKLSLQTIAYGNMRREDMSRFFVEEVFPESDLPSLADLAQGSERLFEITRLRNDRADYERTCRAWLDRLKAHRAAAIEMVGEEVVARYEKYLKLSIIGFHIGTVCLLRLTMHRL
jgi:cyclopropane-fatty-acyl-phospholipid synthase